MNTKTTLSISEARKKIYKIADEVQNPSIYYTLTEKGRPRVVVMSAEEHESMMETLEVMRDLPNLKKEARKVDQDVGSGKYKKYKTLAEIMQKEGFLVSNKSFKKHGLRGKNRTKCGKRTK